MQQSHASNLILFDADADMREGAGRFGGWTESISSIEEISHMRLLARTSI